MNYDQMNKNLLEQIFEAILIEGVFNPFFLDLMQKVININNIWSNNNERLEDNKEIQNLITILLNPEVIPFYFSARPQCILMLFKIQEVNYS